MAFSAGTAVLTELSAVVVFDTTGEHHDRVHERPDADTQQDRKPEEAEQGGDESEKTQAQLQDGDLRRVDIKAANPEHTAPAKNDTTIFTARSLPLVS